MLNSLKGEVAVVTGGARGIGYGIVKRFVGCGINVLLVDKDGENAQAAAGKLSNSPGRIVTFQIDVAEEGAGDKIVSKCIKEFGAMDILVNNAGVYPLSPILEMTPEIYDEIFNVDLKGVAFLSKAAAKKMIEQKKGGKIINIASVDAFFPLMVGLAPYDAAKAGVVMITKSLALELGPYGITVNAIAPGGTATEGTAKMFEELKLSQQEKQKLGENILRSIPLGKMAVPDDIAKIALFLASEGSDYMTGETLRVDGGFVLSLKSR